MKRDAAILEPGNKSSGKAKVGKTRPFRPVIGRTPEIHVAPGAFSTKLVKDVIVPAGKFKATCLALLDRSANGETITITKHGKVVARLVPPEAVEEKPFVPLLGLMKGKVKIIGDIVGPDFEAWGMPDPRKKMK